MALIGRSTSKHLKMENNLKLSSIYDYIVLMSESSQLEQSQHGSSANSLRERKGGRKRIPEDQRRLGRYTICDHCGEKTYYDWRNYKCKRKYVVDPNLSPRAKRREYRRRYMANKATRCQEIMG